MNRLFAKCFAFCVGGIHVVFLLALALGFVWTVLGLPSEAAMGVAAGTIVDGLPTLLLLGLIFFAYVLLIGVVSTLIAINQNLERLGHDADRRGKYEANA